MAPELYHRPIKKDGGTTNLAWFLTYHVLADQCPSFDQSRGSSILLKTNAIFSVSIANAAILNFFELLIVCSENLKPNAIRLSVK